MNLQAKECQKAPANYQKLEKGMEKPPTPRHSTQKELTLLIP